MHAGVGGSAPGSEARRRQPDAVPECSPLWTDTTVAGPASDGTAVATAYPGRVETGVRSASRSGGHAEEAELDVTVKPERAARRAPAYALLGGTASSQVGNQLAALAIPWFVLQTSGSATRTGLVAAFTILPTALASFFGGAVVDRIGSRWLSIVADQLSGVIVAMIPLLHHTIGLGFVPLLALVFLGALFDSPGNTARMALLPEVAKPARMRLEQANAFSQTIQGLSSLLGPPLAGFLIVAMGTSTVLWLEATSFAVSALLVALAVPAPAAKTVPVGSYFDDVREGWRFLWADRLLRAIALTSTVINFLLAPLFAVVLPVYADRVFGSARDLGLMLAGFGLGALVGSTVYGAVGHRLPRRRAIIGSLVLLGLPMWVLATLPGLAVAVTALGVAGLVGGGVNPLAMTVIQERVPVELRGRVIGTVMALALAATPLGMLLSGSLISTIGLAGVLLVIAAAYLATTASLFLNPALHELDSVKVTPMDDPTESEKAHDP